MKTVFFPTICLAGNTLGENGLFSPSPDLLKLKTGAERPRTYPLWRHLATTRCLSIDRRPLET